MPNEGGLGRDTEMVVAELNHDKKRLLKPIALRCLVYLRSAGFYVAECIDLDLIAQGKTADLAMKSLHSAMAGYLKVVLADPNNIDGLLPRRSPLRNRLRYHWYLLRAQITRRRSDFRLYDCSSDQVSSYC